MRAVAKLQAPDGKSTAVSSSSPWLALAEVADDERLRSPRVRPTASPIIKAMSRMQMRARRYQPPRRASRDGFVHGGGGLPLRDLKRCCWDARGVSLPSLVR